MVAGFGKPLLSFLMPVVFVQATTNAQMIIGYGAQNETNVQGQRKTDAALIQSTGSTRSHNCFLKGYIHSGQGEVGKSVNKGRFRRNEFA